MQWEALLLFLHMLQGVGRLSVMHQPLSCLVIVLWLAICGITQMMGSGWSCLTRCLYAQTQPLLSPTVGRLHENMLHESRKCQLHCSLLSIDCCAANTVNSPSGVSRVRTANTAS